MPCAISLRPKSIYGSTAAPLNMESTSVPVMEETEPRSPLSPPGTDLKGNGRIRFPYPYFCGPSSMSIRVKR